MENTQATPKRTYRITILKPAPSMNEETHFVEAGNYMEAVEQARMFWRITGRRTALYSGNDTYWYHWIAQDGRELDRNTNSGVPAVGVAK